MFAGRISTDLVERIERWIDVQAAAHADGRVTPAEAAACAAAGRAAYEGGLRVDSGIKAAVTCLRRGDDNKRAAPEPVPEMPEAA